MTTLIQALDLADPQLAAIVGSGGKTSLMFRLADETLSRGGRVITTTTTKIFYPETDQSAMVLLNDDSGRLAAQAIEAIQTHPHITIAQSVNHLNKLVGIEPGLADDLFEAGICNLIAIEADGARGLDLKAPGSNEPVIPSKTGLVAAVVGLGGLGKPLSEEYVFRPELFAEMARMALGDRIGPEHVARVLMHPQGHFKNAPHKARRVVLLNQADLVEGDTAEQAARLIVDTGGNRFDRVIWGSLQKKNQGFSLITG